MNDDEVDQLFNSGKAIGMKIEKKIEKFKDFKN